MFIGWCCAALWVALNVAFVALRLRRAHGVESEDGNDNNRSLGQRVWH